MTDENSRKSNGENTPDLGGIFARIGKKEQEEASRSQRGSSREEPGDKKSLKALREHLMEFAWARDEVYNISSKFFGRRTAAELDEQYQRLLKSLHFLESPEENSDLALKVMLDEMTSAEAIKKSLLRKSEAELKKALEGFSWPAENIGRLARKYAGDKTAQEIETRYRIILSELPYEDSPDENRDLALAVMEDGGQYESASLEAARRKYSREISKMLGLPSRPYVARLTEKFFGQETAGALLNRCEDISKEIASGAHPRDFEPAIKVLLEDLTQQEAVLEMRALKNQDDIAHIADELGLSKKQTGKLIANCAQPRGKRWFDEEFLRIFKALPEYSDSDRKNAMLAVRVLADEISNDQAFGEAQRSKNREDVLAVAQELMLPSEYADKLLALYDVAGAPAFRGGEYDRLLDSIPHAQELHKSAGQLALKVIFGEITEETAFKMAELIKAFGKFAIPEEDLNEIADKYLDKKSSEELLFSFESILEKLPYMQSREENYGLAISVLISGGAQALDNAINQAQLKKDRAEFQRALNGYGWFSGYASELCEKYFEQKEVRQLISDFEALLAELPYQQKATENYDLGMRVLLGKMSRAEAAREAELRKLFKEAAWSKDYAADMAGAYLGHKAPAEVFDALRERFEKNVFWKNNLPVHRYVAAKVIDELAGRFDFRMSELIFELFSAGVPLEAVREIEKTSASLTGRHFNPQELAERYVQSAADKAPDDPAQRIMEIMNS
jgi:hypothetical protein